MFFDEFRRCSFSRTKKKEKQENKNQIGSRERRNKTSFPNRSVFVWLFSMQAYIVGFFSFPILFSISFFFVFGEKREKLNFKIGVKSYVRKNNAIQLNMVYKLGSKKGDEKWKQNKLK